MKKTVAIMTAALALAVFADTPTVSNVKVQQRYPWNNLVDIDYELSGDTKQSGTDPIDQPKTIGDRQIFRNSAREL